MKQLDKAYINGEWQAVSAPERTHQIVNPADESVVGEIAMAGEAEVDAAVAAAQAALPVMMNSTREQRLEWLDQLVAEYSKRQGEIAEAIRTEMGAPKAWAENAQAPLGAGHIATARSILENFEFHEDKGKNRVQYEPIGVVAMITPWNWPINQIACKVAPAIATGCTMVLKPSELSALSAQLFAEVVDATDLPKGAFNMVFGHGEVVGAALSAHNDVDMVSITGSGRAGTAVQIAAAPTVKRVSQELGGKSANILLEDCDFQKVVAREVGGMMTNTGQTCTARSRLFVPRSRLAEVEEIAKAAASSMKAGDPMADDTRIGPVANEPQYRRVMGYIDKGVAEGAKLIVGGDSPEGKGFYVNPTVFSDVTEDMTIYKEEIFGPVLSIIAYDNEEQAIEMANNTPYGLAGSVSGNDIEACRRVAGQIRAGQISINGAGPTLDMPFGGYKQSGNGREWGEHGFMDFLETKSVLGYNA
jgi:aldehyde dehydrogenase (NAD+)